MGKEDIILFCRVSNTSFYQNIIGREGSYFSNVLFSKKTLSYLFFGKQCHIAILFLIQPFIQGQRTAIGHRNPKQVTIISDPWILLKVLVVLPMAIIGFYGQNSHILNTFFTVCETQFPATPNRLQRITSHDINNSPSSPNFILQTPGCNRIRRMLHLWILPIHVTSDTSFCVLQEQQHLLDELVICTGMRYKHIILIVNRFLKKRETLIAFILPSKFFNLALCQ